MRLSVEISAEVLQPRRVWVGIFKVLKENTCQPKILSPVNLSLKIEEEIKTFPDKYNPKEFITTRNVLQKMPKGILQVEMKGSLTVT